MAIVKKLLAVLCIFALVLSFATCFAASGDTQEGFVNALTEGINQDSMWGSVTPVAPLIIYTFLFAFGFGIIRRVTKKGSKGKFGM